MAESFNPFSLEGKTILVTGASSGIGRGIAIACSKMGARVVGNGRSQERLQQTMAQMEGEGHIMAATDLTSDAEMTAMVASLPVLNGIVHCAGVGERKLCKQIEPSDISLLMMPNFNAPVLLQKEILAKKKLSKQASVVFVASIAPFDPTPGNAVYSASKGALIGYANCLAVELAPRLIRVNCICPAMIWTDLIFKGGLTEEELHEDEKTYPLRRYGRPEDVANAAIFLLSDASSWMTGSCMKITGGKLIG